MDTLIYLEYERLKVKYKEAYSNYDDIIAEKERLFEMTQPHGIRYDGERVSGGANKNPFDEYLIAKEQSRIDERLEEARAILEDRKQILDAKKRDLRESKDVYDKIYRLKFIERWKICRIATFVSYSEPQIYRIIRSIKRRIKDDSK